MKIRSYSKEYKRLQRREWHKFLALWPRRVSHTEIAVGVLMRRFRSDEYEYRTIDEHARILLTNDR